MAFALAIKACNNTARSSRLISTLLMFEILSTSLVRPQQLPNNFERINAVAIDRKKATRLNSEHMLDTVLIQYVPKAEELDK